MAMQPQPEAPVLQPAAIPVTRNRKNTKNRKLSEILKKKAKKVLKHATPLSSVPTTAVADQNTDLPAIRIGVLLLFPKPKQDNLLVFLTKHQK